MAAIAYGFWQQTSTPEPPSRHEEAPPRTPVPAEEGSPPAVAPALEVRPAPRASGAGENQVEPAPSPAPLLVVSRVQPRYPPIARTARVEGVVRLSVAVLADGTVASVTPLAGHELLRPAAAEAVREWRFNPIDSAQTDMRVMIVDVEFDLDGR